MYHKTFIVRPRQVWNFNFACHFPVSQLHLQQSIFSFAGGLLIMDVALTFPNWDFTPSLCSHPSLGNFSSWGFVLDWQYLLSHQTHVAWEEQPELAPFTATGPTCRTSPFETSSCFLMSLLKVLQGMPIWSENNCTKDMPWTPDDLHGPWGSQQTARTFCHNSCRADFKWRSTALSCQCLSLGFSALNVWKLRVFVDLKRENFLDLYFILCLLRDINCWRVVPLKQVHEMTYRGGSGNVEIQY